MFNSQIAFPVTVNLTGDIADETYSVWKAPFAGEVIDLWAVVGATLTAGNGTGLAVVLQNGGQVGTATTALGTVGSGTADTRWVVDKVVAGSVGVATFAAGDVLAIQYDETGTYNPAWLNVGFNVRYGTS
jgi:hypothetical protein